MIEDCYFTTQDPALKILASSCWQSVVEKHHYEPKFIVPPQIRSLNPAWTTCGLQYLLVDPPIALSTKSMFLPTVSHPPVTSSARPVGVILVPLRTEPGSSKQTTHEFWPNDPRSTTIPGLTSSRIISKPSAIPTGPSSAVTSTLAANPSGSSVTLGSETTLSAGNVGMSINGMIATVRNGDIVTVDPVSGKETSTFYVGSDSGSPIAAETTILNTIPEIGPQKTRPDDEIAVTSISREGGGSRTGRWSRWTLSILGLVLFWEEP